MKPTVLAAMAASGLLLKKDRILCFRDRDKTMTGWLRRQRFKAEAVSVESLTTTGKTNDIRFFDVVIMGMETEGCENEDDRERNARALYALLKPGGRFLACFQNEDLFDCAFEQDVKDAAAGWFVQESVASVRKLPRTDNLPAEIVVVKKGGVYTPRLPVRYIADADSFAKACDALCNAKVLGLDVETTLNEPRILCTVQLATEEAVYLIDALPIRDYEPLKRLLENDGVVKIIHNKSFEEKVLAYYGVKINNVYDTLIASRKRHKKNKRFGHNLGEVCERELGIYLDKSLQASDWTVRPLTPEQRDYAAADAEVLIRLYHLFVPPKTPENLELF